ncbi:MAG: 2-isopropylmalate synthase [Planctomycetota bacterium]
MAKIRLLEEVQSPKLFEGIFPHTAPPQIRFDGVVSETIGGQVYEADLSNAAGRDLVITDTTFRDGQQARTPYTIDQIAHLYELLSRLGGPNGVVRQTEFFLYSKKDRQAVECCRDLGLRYPEITGWIRAELTDLKLVKEMGLPESGLLTSCSDYHIFLKLKLDRKKALGKYLGVVKEAIEHGIRPRCHLEDVTRADIYGFVIPFVQELTRLSENLPPEKTAKVRLCDTMGFGLSYPGAGLPRSVPKIVLLMKHECGVPGENLEWHGHNDFHKVFTNATTAWLYGCDALNSTLIGIGERTGNPPLEGAIMEYIGLKGAANGTDTRVITEIAEYYRSIGTRISVRYPLVGDNFHKTRAGIHAGGLLADERIYNIFDTQALLNRPPEVAITDKSGSEGVALWVNNFLDLHGKDRIRRIAMVRIMRWVDDQYNVHGRTTAISDQEMIEQVRLYLPEKYKAAEAAGRLTMVHHEE